MGDPAARSLDSGFLRSADRFPDRPALELAGRAVTYAELRDQAAMVAASIAESRRANGVPLVAVLAHRNSVAFSAILGALAAGCGYVPLNPRFPSARNAAMLERSGADVVVVEPATVGQLEEILGAVPSAVTVIEIDGEQVRVRASDKPRQRLVYPAVDAAPAYLLFTSGSTGVPKGVLVTQKNVNHVVDWTVTRYGITETDRFSQTFDLTFDLSAFDMFVAWEAGACVCCLTDKELVAPAQFLRRAQPTVWFSVPSTAVVMRRLGMLKPGSYPSLRWSLFCGEGLPADIAEAWAAAAPNSIVENLYGPTEATIACTTYRWDPASATECALGLVPIGHPAPGMQATVVSSALEPLADGEDGELVVAGPQIAAGYWDDDERTAVAFIRPPWSTGVAYRTGDRVRRDRAGGPLLFLGRSDSQVKIRGYRVELAEVEAAVRAATGRDAVVALAWPPAPATAHSIVTVVDVPVDATDLRARLSERLPDYMVPREVVVVSDFPLNVNGKIDRTALLRILEQAC